MAVQLDIVFHDQPGAEAPATPGAAPTPMGTMAQDLAKHLKEMGDKALQEMKAGTPRPVPMPLGGPVAPPQPLTLPPTPAGTVPAVPEARYGDRLGSYAQPVPLAESKALRDLGPTPASGIAPPPGTPLGATAPPVPGATPASKVTPKAQSGAADMLSGLASGAGSGALAAAGPVGAAVGIAGLVANKAREAIAKPAEIAESFSDSSQRLARNNVSGLSKALEVLPGPLGEAAKSATRIAESFELASNSFIERGKEIQGFSGQLTQANAQAEIRQLMTDMREARDLGPELAGLTDAKSQLDASFSEAMAPIKSVMVDILADAAKTLTAFIEFFKPAFEAVADVVRFIRGLMQQLIDVVASVLEWMNMNNLAEPLRQIAQNTQPAPPAADPLIEQQLAWLDARMQWAAGRPGTPPSQPQPPGLDIPAVLQQQQRR